MGVTEASNEISLDLSLPCKHAVTSLGPFNRFSPQCDRVAPSPESGP